MQETRDYTTVAIDLNLAGKIDNVLKKGGYLNRGDFIREAIRKALKEYESEV